MRKKKNQKHIKTKHCDTSAAQRFEKIVKDAENTTPASGRTHCTQRQTPVLGNKGKIAAIRHLIPGQQL